MTATQPTTSPAAAVYACAASTLGQCRGLLASLSDEAYTTPCPTMFNGTIGQHVRHALDHFAGAINAGGAPIEYDKRSRGTTIESSRTDAISTIDRLCETLAGLGGKDKAVTIRVMLSSGGDEAELPSTQSREVFFATHHAFHHHAMMASIAGTLGVEAPAGFGKAPATINNEGVCSTGEKA